MKYLYRVVFTLFLLIICQISFAGYLRIVNVDPFNNKVTIKNYGGFGSNTIDISSYYLESNFTPILIADLPIVSGSLILNPNATVILNMNLNSTTGDVSLFCPNNTLPSPCLLDFVEWGSSGNGRESLAISRGIWTANTWISGTPPYSKCHGNATDYGVEYWCNSPFSSFYIKNTLSLCSADSVHFVVSTSHLSANSVKYLWDFGDNTTSTAISPIHLYMDSGVYNIQLIANDTLNGTSDTTTKSLNLPLCPPLSSFDFSIHCYSGNINFWDNGNNSKITSYRWDFWDGTTSTLQNPKHLIPDTGIYTVRLIVMDNFQVADTTTKSIHIGLCPPLSDFDWGGSCSNQLIFFHTNIDNARITSSAWDFGDGTTSTLQNPSHAFPDTGTYNVRLIVVDNFQVTDTTTKSVQIKLCTPISAFYWGGGCSSDSIHFTSQVNSTMVKSYFWNFNDGTASTLQNPKHLFPDTGTYNVSLIVMSNFNVLDTTTKSVHIGLCPPLSNFGWNSTFPCPSTSIVFNSWGITTKITSYAWDFGDGTTSTLQNPSHLFSNSGTHNVRLIVVDNFNVPDTTIKSIQIKLLSDFNWGNGCSSDPISFWRKCFSANITSSTWDFGDGTTSTLPYPSHVFPSSGTYNVRLTVVDTFQVPHTTTKSVQIDACPPLSNFDWEELVCYSDTVHFWSKGPHGKIAFYLWDFGDGSVSAAQNPEHIYADTGNYTVTLIVTDTAFNSNSNDTTVKIINHFYQCQHATSLSDFSYNGCKDTLWFHSIGFQLGAPGTPSSIAIDSRTWTFAHDSSIATGSDIQHVFPDTGSYLVTLITTSAGVPDTTTKIIQVSTCNSGNGIFGWNNTCLNDTTSFVDSSTVANITVWSWNFGDGTTSALSNPTHVYSAAGAYSVLLVVSNSIGIVDTAIKIVDIIDCSVPISNTMISTSSTDAICFGGATGMASVTATGELTPYTYLWNNGATTNSINNLVAGTYWVNIIGADTATISDTIIIGEPSQLIITTSNDTSVCQGTAINLSVTGANSYNWSTGNSSNIITISPSITTLYTVSGFNANGCTVSDSVMVTIFNLPQPIITAAQTTVCKGDKVFISVTGADHYQWNNGMGVGDTINPTIINNVTFIVESFSVEECVQLDTILITVAQLPIITTSIIDAACGQATGSDTAFVSGGTAPYNYTWASGQSTFSLTNVVAGLYSLTVSDANNCKGEIVVAISDQDGPTVNIISSNNANCSGSDGSTNIAVSGGQPPFNYVWTNGASTQNLEFIKAGTYGIEVTDANNCVGTASIEIVDIGTNAPSISGHVKSAFNGANINGGKVLIFSEIGNGGTMEEIASTTIDTIGFYNFPSVLPIGNYILMAVADTSIYPFTIPTYFGLTNKWDSAVIVTAICDSAMIIDIDVIDLVPLGGTSTLAGNLSTDNQNKTGKFIGGPIPGVNIFLEQISGGIVANTQTDGNGNYSFDKVSASDSSYTIYVDIPGLKMVQSYIFKISSSDTLISNLNFLASDTTIFITATNVSVEEQQFPHGSLNVYPNPYQGSTTIEYNLTKTENIQLKIYSILGELVYGKSVNQEGIGIHRIQFSTAAFGYKAGVYFVNLTIGNEVITKRIIEIR